MIWLKNYSCHNVFNQKDIITFDVLTFIQVRTDKNKNKKRQAQVRKDFNKRLCEKNLADCHEQRVQINFRQQKNIFLFAQSPQNNY